MHSETCTLCKTFIPVTFYFYLLYTLTVCQGLTWTVRDSDLLPGRRQRTIANWDLGLRKDKTAIYPGFTLSQYTSNQNEA